MSFGHKQQDDPTPKKLANLDGDDIATNQPAVPVPYVAGRFSLPLIWFTPAYDRGDVPVTTSTQKGKTQITGFKSHASLAGAVCMGPLDALFRVRSENEVVWDAGATPPTRGGGTPDFVNITIPDLCPQARFYWGTETQPVDTLILGSRGTRPADDPDFDPRDPSTWDDYDPANATGVVSIGHYDGHPAYSGISYIALRALEFGQGRENAPSLSIEAQRAPLFLAPSGLTDAGANAAAVLYEAMTNGLFGIGIPTTAFPADKWTAAHAAVDAWRINPVVTTQGQFRAFAAKAIDYFGGWGRVVGETIEVGIWPRGEIDTTGLVRLTDADLSADPELDPEGYDDTINQVRLKFSNLDRSFADDVAPATSAANRATVGEDRSEEIDRAWVILQSEANRFAVDYVQRKSLPQQTASLEPHCLAADDILPGQIILLDTASVGVEQAFRVIAAERPAAGEGVTKLDLERANWAVAFVPPPRPRDPDFTIRPFAITRRRAVELPAGLKTTAAVQLAVLAQRPDPTVKGFRVHVSADNATYELVSAENAFAAYGTLQADYSGTTGTLDTTAGMLVQLVGPDGALVEGQSDLARDDDTLLMFVGNEIISVGAAVSASGGLRIYGRRARYGTTKAAHANGTPVWIIARAKLPRLENRFFLAGATVWLKLQAYSADGENPLADVTAYSLALTAASGVSTVSGLTLSTYARLAAGNQIEVHVQASWTAVLDQEVEAYEVAIKRAGDSAGQVIYRTTTETTADWMVAPGTAYSVSVRAINSYGERGPFSALATIVSATDEAFGVAGLETKAGGSTWTGPDVEVLWSLQQLTGGIGTGDQHPMLRDYRVRIWKRPPSPPGIDYGYVIARETYVADPRFNYSRERNEEDDGASRYIKIGVSARSTQGNHSNEVELEVANPMPLRITSLDAYEFEGNTLKLQLPRPADVDFNEWWIWRRAVPGAPSPATLEEEFSNVAPLLKSRTDRFDVSHEAGAEWQYVISAVDDFSTPLQPGTMAAFNLTNNAALLQSPVPPPSVDPPSRVFSPPDFISVYATAEPGLSIRYSLDGSPVTPLCDLWAGGSPPPAHGEFPDTVFIRFACFDAAGRKSEEVQRNYIRTTGPDTTATATPSIHKTGLPGKVGTGTITCATPSATIYYRKNGGSWTTYTGGFGIAVNDVVQAYAQASGLAASDRTTYDNTGWSGPGVEP